MDDAPSPYPKGPAPDLRTTANVMEFRVDKPLLRPETRPIPRTLRTIPPLPEEGATVRHMAFREYEDARGEPLIILLNGRKWPDLVTVRPRLDGIEVWHLINATEDAHPIHLHLVHFLVIDRQRFNREAYLRDRGADRPGEGLEPIAVAPYMHGPRRVPPPHKRWWKDTYVQTRGRLSASSRGSTATPERIHGIATCSSMRTTR
jgi:spore coat protein A